MAKHFYSPIDPYTESFVLPFRGKQQHVNFWGTPEKIGAQRFKLAMSFALPFRGKQQQVNFWCTPEKIWAQRFKLAMSFVLPFRGKQQQVNFWGTPEKNWGTTVQTVAMWMVEGNSRF